MCVKHIVEGKGGGFEGLHAPEALQLDYGIISASPFRSP